MPVILFLGFTCVPIKSSALTLGGQSMYLPYGALVLAAAFMFRPLLDSTIRNFGVPMLVMSGLAVFHFAMTGFSVGVLIYAAKVLVLLLLAGLYAFLLGLEEGRAMHYLFVGAAISIAFMVYQSISMVAFQGALPFTQIPVLEIGRGISNRYGLLRVTGLTEEPSYIALMLLGIAFILHSYGRRSGVSQNKRVWIVALSLLLCTSNSLFATLPLVAIYGLFSFLKLPLLFFVVFYGVNLALAPTLQTVDVSFFDRFTSYVQYLSLNDYQKVFGIGLSQYGIAYPIPRYQGLLVPGLQQVESLASLWGGVLLEGGLVFAVLFSGYVSHIATKAKHGFGFGFMAILLMLANYYSPWWPIVSLSLAYAVVSAKDKPASGVPA